MTWIGRATIERPNRITVAFDVAVTDDDTLDITGMAVSTDNLPGVAANIQDQAHAAVQDMLRAAVGGVSDYVDARLDRQRLSVQDGVVIIEDVEVPPLGDIIGGRVAQLFDLPSGQTAVIRVARLAPGTPFQVLYGIAP